jgi:hypothetical protein
VAGSAELAWRPAKGLPKRTARLGDLRLLGWRQGHLSWPLWLRRQQKSPGLGRAQASRAQIANRQLVQVEAVKGLSNPVFYEDRKVWRLLFSVKSLF